MFPILTWEDFLEKRIEKRLILPKNIEGYYKPHIINVNIDEIQAQEKQKRTRKNYYHKQKEDLYTTGKPLPLYRLIK